MNSYNILHPDAKNNIMRFFIEEDHTADSWANECGVAKPPKPVG